MKIHSIFSGITAVTLVLASPQLMANSSRILNKANKHYYQLFNSANKTWDDAKSICENMSAHLVTITSSAENTFLGDNLYGEGDAVWMGLYIADGSHWVNGEPIVAFNKFENGKYPKEPGDIYYFPGYGWGESSGTEARPYVCEWEPAMYESVMSLPDINGNGSPETAALYIETKTYSHNVVIKDNSAGTIIKTIPFDTNNTNSPIALAQVSDMSGNGVPEIAVMYWTKKSGAIGSMIGLMIKDASTGEATRATPITILSTQYKAIALTSTPDITGDGINELEVLVMKYSNSATSSQIIDPVSGTVVKTVNF